MSNTRSPASDTHADGERGVEGHEITAFVFDFGKVICSFDMQLFVARLARTAGVGEIVVSTRLNDTAGIIIDYETGLMSSEEFFRRFTAGTPLTVGIAEFRDAYCGIFFPIRSTFTLIQQLKPRYRLGLLSNTNEWHFEYGIRPVEVFPLFDTVTLSYEVKAMKPDERIYRDALAKLGRKPGACVYIDDLEENVQAARALGMHALHYVSHRELLASLEELGVTL